jgi:hypothetical protein
MRHLLFVALLFTVTAAAAQPSCLCTSGCSIASDPYTTGSGQPTSCTVYKAGVSIGTGAVVASSTIPLSNAAKCTPASPAYVPGVASNVSCLVSIGAQAAGTVTISMTATDAAGESAQSSPFTFVSVAALPTIPASPLNLRVTQSSPGLIVLASYAARTPSTPFQRMIFTEEDL